MKKQLLTVEFDFNFMLIGLCCASRDYRICYELNNKLGLSLRKVDDLVPVPIVKSKTTAFNLLTEAGDSIAPRYSVYVYRHHRTGLIYNVISNKSQGSFLIPEKRECDYFFMITGEAHEKEKREAFNNIKAIPMVLAAFEINPYGLKSKDRLILND